MAIEAMNRKIVSFGKRNTEWNGDDNSIREFRVFYKKFNHWKLPLSAPRLSCESLGAIFPEEPIVT